MDFRTRKLHSPIPGVFQRFLYGIEASSYTPNCHISEVLPRQNSNSHPVPWREWVYFIHPMFILYGCFYSRLQMTMEFLNSQSWKSFLSECPWYRAKSNFSATHVYIVLTNSLAMPLQHAFLTSILWSFNLPFFPQTQWRAVEYLYRKSPRYIISDFTSPNRASCVILKIVPCTHYGIKQRHIDCQPMVLPSGGLQPAPTTVISSAQYFNWF